MSLPSADVVLVIDIDGTLCDLDYGGRLDRWRKRIEQDPPPPLQAAVSALSPPPPVRLAITTPRHESLRRATRTWLDLHFPALVTAPLYMRAEDDSTDVEIRAAHVCALRGGARVVLVDNDLDMQLALQPGDRLVHAPRDWKWVWRMVDEARR